MRRLLAGLSLTAVLTTACGGGDGEAAIKLDGSPRAPSDAGVVEEVSKERITIDDEEYAVSDRLLAFSTTTLEAVPLLQRKGQYVQVGLEDDEVVWLASIGAVVAEPEPAVYYFGTVKRQSGRLVTFRDGTILELAPDVPKLEAGSRLQAEIDPSSDLVRRVVIG